MSSLLTVVAIDVAAQAPLENSAAPRDYRIGPGDVIEIFVWQEPELSVTIPVRPDGKITSPLVEDLSAVGRTSSQLATEIERVLSEFVRTPEVNVIIHEFAGMADQQVRVLGQAVQPQSIPYRDGMTILDVLIAVGGLTEFANGNRSRVVRTVDGEDREIRVRLNRLIEKGDVKENIEMQPGDVLVIPQSVF